MTVKEEDNNCELCERTRELTFHHLVPRSMHKRKWVQRSFSAEQRQEGLMLCRDCHSAIHRFFDCAELARNRYSKEKLLEHDDFLAFVLWIRKQRKDRSKTKRYRE